MLCRACHRRLPRTGDACQLCGVPRPGETDRPRYAVVLPDGTRVPVRGPQLSVGRAAGNRLRLDDPAVSRRHARLFEDPAGVGVRDLGSSSGTFLRGHRLADAWLARDGDHIRVGDTFLRVEQERSDDAGRTVMVPVGASLRISALSGATRIETAVPTPARPRLRPGNGFPRFTANEAELVRRLDGRHTVAEIVDDVEREHGAAAVSRLEELIPELDERGLLAGATPTVRGTSFACDRVEAVYRRLGWLLFTTAGLTVIAALAIVGAVAFASLVAGDEVRPFQVGDGLGWIAFLAGSIAAVVVAKLAHALTLASFGRRPRLGLRCVTFEVRSRRMAVAAAGLVADVCLAGLFSLIALCVPGLGADIAYPLALGAYLGALLNLNPMTRQALRAQAGHAAPAAAS
jgi:pSer/pThr/pTyr-binding forkhead associated (FHA) protein